MMAAEIAACGDGDDVTYIQADEFTDWNVLRNEGFDTAASFKFSKGLVPKDDEKPSAHFIERKRLSAAEWNLTVSEFQDERNAATEASTLLYLERRHRSLQPKRIGSDEFEIVSKSISLYHVDQMKPGNFRSRTKVIIKFGNIFWRPMNRSNYIKKNRNLEEYDAKWFTKDFDKQDSVLSRFWFFDERKLKEHLSQKEIYGVKPNAVKDQYFGAIDLDLHVEKNGNPIIFLKQVEALLTYLHGKGWIICLGTDVVNGIHLMKLYESPRPLAAIRSEIQSILNSVAAKHPDLELKARNAGMSPIADAEIFPDPSRGFRLPLGIGYTAITSEPLTLKKYHTTVNGVPLLGADVESLMSWDGTEMPLQEKLQYIKDRIPKNGPDLDAKAKGTTKAQRHRQEQEEAAVRKQATDEKLLGNMSGCFAEKLVAFYRGELQVPGSLQTGILLGLRALRFQNYPIEDRTEYLIGLLQDIELSGPEFSSRLWGEEWDVIRDDIDHVLWTQEKLYELAETPDIQRSIRILNNWATKMDRIAFNFGDPDTWDNCQNGNLTNFDDIRFTSANFSEDDLDLIATQIAGVFKVRVAAPAVAHVIERVRHFEVRGDGISRELRRDLLTECGVKCQENEKLAECWNVMVEVGFISIRSFHNFNSSFPGKGRARTYAVGRRVREYFINTHYHEIVFPEWLTVLLRNEKESPWFSETETCSTPERDISHNDHDEEWRTWTRACLDGKGSTVFILPLTST